MNGKYAKDTGQIDLLSRNERKVFENNECAYETLEV